MHTNISKTLDGLIILFSNGFAILAINVSYIPVICSLLMTGVGLYKHYLEIKKLKGK